MKIKNKHVFLVGVLLALTSILGPNLLSFQQSADELYQAGVLKKSGDGNLEEAISLFQKIVDNFPDNRELASQSLLQIGLCYDLLGEKKAETAFRKLIADYPDQKDAVQIAKEKLALLSMKSEALDISSKELTLREVSSPYGSPSPNGRFILFYEGDGDMNISLFDTRTDEKIPITQYEPCRFCWCSGATWSNDGEKIAFIKGSTEEVDRLHIIGAFDHKDKIIFSDPEMEVFEIAGWSPNDQKIYVEIRYKNYSHSLGEIHVDSGAFKEIFKFEKNIPDIPRSSPDGRYFAYSQRNQENARWDIMITATDGGDTYSLVDHPSGSKFLGWTPDNTSILFSSSRAGSDSIWIQEIFDGRPVGDPKRIQGITGFIWPYGFTQFGSFYFSELHLGGDVYTAQVDLSTGKTIQSPERIEKTIQGHTSTPFWSQDGKYLGYLSRQFQKLNPSSYNILRIRSTDTGKEKEFLLDFQPTIYSQLPRWSPDGKYIYFKGSQNGKNGLFQIDVQSGESNLFNEQKGLVAFSPDASIIYYTERTRTTKMTDWQNWITRIDIDEEKKELIRSSLGELISGISLSIDGKWLNFLKMNFRENKNLAAPFVMSTESGKPLDLSPFVKKDFTIRFLFWGPLGKGILYTQMRPSDSEQSKTELFYLSEISQGISPIKMEIDMWDISYLSFHPDGKTIAFTSGKAQKEKFWILENFLSQKKDK
ncbi:tetratricopeptide repeat protein [Acidobacteriota bacterium]